MVYFSYYSGCLEPRVKLRMVILATVNFLRALYVQVRTNRWILVYSSISFENIYKESIKTAYLCVAWTAALSDDAAAVGGRLAHLGLGARDAAQQAGEEHFLVLLASSALINNSQAIELISSDEIIIPKLISVNNKQKIKIITTYKKNTIQILNYKER